MWARLNSIQDSLQSPRSSDGSPSTHPSNATLQYPGTPAINNGKALSIIPGEVFSARVKVTPREIHPTHAHTIHPTCNRSAYDASLKLMYTWYATTCRSALT